MTATGTPRILAFDIFGTVVDWHGSIAREVDGLVIPDRSLSSPLPAPMIDRHPAGRQADGDAHRPVTAATAAPGLP